jgi:hypothetical protein
MTSGQISSSQNAISSFMNGQNFYMQVHGSATRPVSSTYCMIQSMIDVMPSIYVPVKGSSTTSTSEQTIDPETGLVKVSFPLLCLTHLFALPSDGWVCMMNCIR